MVRRLRFVRALGADGTFHAASPVTTTACWATAAAMGPAPARAMIEGILQNNKTAIATLQAAIDWTAAPIEPILEKPEVFASYNIQIEKLRIDEAGYCTAGPMRPPYDYIPPDYERAARECGRCWAALCRNHLGDFRFKDEPWRKAA